MAFGAHHGRTAAAAADPSASDGVVIMLPFSAAAAKDTIVGVLRACGFVVDGAHSDRSTVSTRPRVISADTSMVVAAEIAPVDMPGVQSVVAFSATYSVPSRNVRNAQLVKVDGSSQTLWRTLSDVAEALRRTRTPKG